MQICKQFLEKQVAHSALYGDWGYFSEDENILCSQDLGYSIATPLGTGANSPFLAPVNKYLSLCPTRIFINQTLLSLLTPITKMSVKDEKAWQELEY